MNWPLPTRRGPRFGTASRGGPRLWRAWVIGLLLLTACAAPTPTAMYIVVPRENPSPTAGPARPTADYPTPTLFPTTDFLSTPGRNIDRGNTLSFNFGTQTAVPTLGWRPPPLPVPLSIRPEDHFWFARPIASNAVNWPHPLYRYGSTYFGYMNAHTGVDLDSPLGTPVLAAGPGTVVWVGFGLLGTNPPENDPYGNAVVIKHNFGYNNQPIYTIYAHMSTTSVWLNQPVQTGDQLGQVGLTGFTTGPHLHFEVRIGENRFRSTYNPELWLAPPTGWGVLAGRVLDKDGRYISELPIEVYDWQGRYYPIWTYSTRSVNADPIYRENFVISDLPAGTYRYAMTINGERYVGRTEILAGQTTFVIVQEAMTDIPVTAEPAATNGKAPTQTYTPSLTYTPSDTPTVTRTPRPSRTPPP